MDYKNYHNLYKLPYFSPYKYIEELKNKYKTYDLMDSNNKSKLRRLAYEEEVEKIRRDFINKNFDDLNDDEKDILLNNLIKAEQFSPTERYYHKNCF